jgi:hypothetical protein
MRQVALLVVLVCVLAVPVAGTAGVAGPASQQATQSEASVPEEGVDVTIQIRPDGSARWNISTKYALHDENDTAAFEDLRDEFEAYQTDSEFSVDVFRAVVPEVSEQVGRDMEIRNAGRSSTVVDHGNNSTGVLSVEFTWVNFTRVQNETLVVDSFSGSWFGDLKAEQSLTIRPPEGYDTTSVQPAASIQSGAYKWTGPEQFAFGEPTAVFTEAPEPPNGPIGVSMMTVVGIGVLALLVGAILVWAYYRGFPGGRPGGIPSLSAWLGDSDEDDAAADGAPDGTEAADEPDTGGGVDEAATTGAAAGTAGGQGVDPELLSDEERVEQLLREHGGRMKQSKIVEETRWSTAKVSQLLSSMADEGRVEKLRIGRENLISLPDEGLDEGLDR